MEDFGQILTVLFNSSKIDNEDLYCIIDNLVGLDDDIYVNKFIVLCSNINPK